MMFRVRLAKGVKLEDVLFESRSREECKEFIKKVSPKYFSTTELSLTEAKVSIYTYNFDDPFKPQLLSDYRTYRAARAAVLDPAHNWEDGYKFWWVYDEEAQNVMLCNENGEMSCAELYEDWFKKNEPINTYKMPRVKEAYLYEVSKKELAEMRKAIMKKAAKKVQLVHLDFTRAKQSTSKEEYREAFFAYMQREDC